MERGQQQFLACFARLGVFAMDPELSQEGLGVRSKLPGPEAANLRTKLGARTEAPSKGRSMFLKLHATSPSVCNNMGLLSTPMGEGGLRATRYTCGFRIIHS